MNKKEIRLYAIILMFGAAFSWTFFRIIVAGLMFYILVALKKGE